MPAFSVAMVRVVWSNGDVSHHEGARGEERLVYVVSANGDVEYADECASRGMGCQIALALERGDLARRLNDVPWLPPGIP